MTEMLAIVAPSYCDPSGYVLSTTVAKPVLTDPSDVIIRVHAASVNPIDVKLASGLFKMALTDEFPYRIGYDCAGVITEVGQNVTRFKVGDEVYTRLPERSRGSWSEYVNVDGSYVAAKPANLSCRDAAALPLAAMTALQALGKYQGSLAGKTVFVPAGLGGSGSYACQLAKNVFGAGKVITTVSTSKVAKVPQLLGEGVVDQVIDYTKGDPKDVIPPQSVDFMLDTTGQAMQFLSLMKPSTGLIISISTQPSGTQLQESGTFVRPEKPRVPWWIRLLLNTTDSLRKFRAQRWQVQYSYMFLDSNGKDLEVLKKHVEDGKVAPVIGSTCDLKDIEKVKEACQLVYAGKGGIGKAVFEVVPR